MNYIEDFKEPIEFIFSENLLSGNNTSKKISNDDIIDEFFFRWRMVYKPFNWEWNF